MSNEILQSFGFFVGERDTNLNKQFSGKFMVCESSLLGKQTNDASQGGFCIVGDDLDELIQETINHFEYQATPFSLDTGY